MQVGYRVGLPCPQQTSIKRTTLLRELGGRMGGAADGVGSSKDAESLGDPMNEVEDSLPQAKKRKTNVRRPTNTVKGACIVTGLPSKCPEMHPECTETHSITFYVVDHSQIWLAIDDVAWAVQYMHNQTLLKGVTAVLPEDTGPDGAAPQIPTHIPQTDLAGKLDASAEVPGVPATVAEEEESN